MDTYPEQRPEGTEKKIGDEPIKPDGELDVYSDEQFIQKYISTSRNRYKQENPSSGYVQYLIDTIKRLKGDIETNRRTALSNPTFAEHDIGEEPGERSAIAESYLRLRQELYEAEIALDCAYKEPGREAPKDSVDRYKEIEESPELLWAAKIKEFKKIIKSYNEVLYKKNKEGQVIINPVLSETDVKQFNETIAKLQKDIRRLEGFVDNLVQNFNRKVGKYAATGELEGSESLPTPANV
ncbi:MAG: hypothetical protein QG645_717 [Patescibacteria group bacterium]|nr:hypothetical protein [Patescibacteria group bacterium]MDQ5953827.1 hypothetical protein [Patescibacteria group bacterium]